MPPDALAIEAVGLRKSFGSTVAVSGIDLSVRGILDGSVTPGAIGLSLAAPAAIAALCGPLAMALYRRER